MLKAYKYRIYPTKSQIELIEKHFGCVRFVYNYFLDYRKTMYAKGSKVNYYDTQKELVKLKKLDKYEWLKEVNSQSLVVALRNLDNAFKKFFIKQGGYPKYKSKKYSHQSFTAPQHIKLIGNRLYIPKFAKDGIKVKLHRKIPKNAILKQATISRHNSQYFVSILVEDNVPIPKPTKSRKAVGLDMGIEYFVATSDGVLYPNPKFYVKSLKRLNKLQRRLSRKQKDSKNREKAKLRLQKMHTKITNQRKDYLHKISNEITNRYDVICIETLNIKGMIKNRHLSKSIADVSWGEFARQLEYKSKWKGKYFIKIDKWFPSSQICSNCGAFNGKKPLHVRKWTCKECGVTHHRDINAAINIMKYGLSLLENKNTAGTAGIYACGVSSGGAVVSYETVVSYGAVASHGTMKQEARSF